MAYSPDGRRIATGSSDGFVGKVLTDWLVGAYSVAWLVITAYGKVLTGWLVGLLVGWLVPSEEGTARKIFS